MAAKTKPKAAAIIAVPQSREEAVRQLGLVGELRRGIARIKSLADAQIKTVGEGAEAEIAPLREQLAAVEKGLQTWCEANRAGLTNDGRVKFADLGTGRVLWRARPPRVNIRGVDVVIEGIKRLGLVRFLRVKEEVNKEAMLAEPDVANTLHGVSISSEGEDFVLEPAELRLADGSAS